MTSPTFRRVAGSDKISPWFCSCGLKSKASSKHEEHSSKCDSLAVSGRISTSGERLIGCAPWIFRCEKFNDPRPAEEGRKRGVHGSQLLGDGPLQRSTSFF